MAGTWLTKHGHSSCMPFLHTSSKAAMIDERFRNCWPWQRQIDNDLDPCSQLGAAGVHSSLDDPFKEVVLDRSA